jgi:hypothetical protein
VTNSNLILRSGLKDRVSKDGGTWRWFETLRGAKLFTMRA